MECETLGATMASSFGNGKVALETATVPWRKAMIDE